MQFLPTNRLHWIFCLVFFVQPFNFVYWLIDCAQFFFCLIGVNFICWIIINSLLWFKKKKSEKNQLKKNICSVLSELKRFYYHINQFFPSVVESVSCVANIIRVKFMLGEKKIIKLCQLSEREIRVSSARERDLLMQSTVTATWKRISCHFSVCLSNYRQTQRLNTHTNTNKYDTKNRLEFLCYSVNKVFFDRFQQNCYANFFYGK